jgi:hypothetical protein
MRFQKFSNMELPIDLDIIGFLIKNLIINTLY